jgi:hypothetical protein
VSADPPRAGEKIADWAHSMAGQGRLRLAIDCTWLVENGVQVPFAKLRDAALLSACDLRIGAERAAKVIPSGYIVLEDTMSVYVKR